MTQCEKVVKYMKENGTITQREALGLGIYRLASRISDLRMAGVKIKTEDVKVQNVDGTFSWIARYSFLEEKKV